MGSNALGPPGLICCRCCSLQVTLKCWRQVVSVKKASGVPASPTMPCEMVWSSEPRAVGLQETYCTQMGSEAHGPLRQHDCLGLPESQGVTWA